MKSTLVARKSLRVGTFSVKKMSLKFNNGLDIPSLGFGTWLLNPAGIAVKHALQHGFKHIDCAEEYGNENEIGAILGPMISSGEMKRKDLFVTSKLWVDNFSCVEDACRRSLNSLQLDYLDLYLVHFPFEMEKSLPSTGESTEKGVIGYNPNRFLEVWTSMEDLVAKGLVKSIGVSNLTVKKLRDLLDRKPMIVPACNQVELHPYLPQTKLLEFCKQHGIVLMAYTALGNNSREDEFVKTGDPVLLEDPVIKEIAVKNFKTPAQILLAWAIARGHAVLVKSARENRIKENLGSLNVKLSDDDIQIINNIKTRHRYLDHEWACKVDQKPEDLWDGEFLG